MTELKFPAGSAPVGARRIASGPALHLVLIALLCGCAATPSPEAEPVQVYAAGSLREALTTIAREHESRTGQKVSLTFGPSGVMRERIEQGAPAQVFASADTDHPQRLAQSGGWQAPVVFVRNQLCALASDKISVTPETLLATLLKPDVRVGTSTPKADPGGDYAWAMFRRADAVRPGAYAALDAKALKLVGGPNSPQPPVGRGASAWMMDQGKADVFMSYCTSAMAAQKEVPRLRVVQLPANLQVSAAYGLTVREGATPAARAFAQALREPAAQRVFGELGFRLP